jgi:hypothetical protein
VLIGVAVLLVIVAGIVIAVKAGQTQDTAMKAQHGVAVNKQEIVGTQSTATKADHKATALQKRVKVVEIRTVRDHTVLREKQIIGPNGQPGPGGLRGPQGPPGKVTFTLEGVIDGVSPLVIGRLSERLDATLPDVVAANCGGSCNGTDGRDGKDAPPVTPEAINAAVAANCGGSCKGDPGVNGTNGVDGQPGANGVDGQPGANGQDGAPGTPGTVVLSVQTACPDGNGGFVAGVATDPDGDGNFTCP